MDQTLKPSHIRGTIRAIDPAKRSLSIENLVLNKDFEVALDALIVTTAHPEAALSELKSGDLVDIIYEEIGPHHIAHRVAQAAELMNAGDCSGEFADAMKSIQELSHARGKIMAVNLEKSLLRVQGLVMKKTFQVVSDAVITTVSRPAATLKDLRLGDRVDVYYEDISSESIAYRITQTRVPQHWQAL